MIEDGAQVPDVALQMADGATVRLSQLRLPLVLYFYPKDDTSGCTSEAKDFSQLLDEFDQTGTAVLGVSRNTPKEHAKFSAKHELSVPLATDADGNVTEAFGVWVEKSMYGRKYMGIERATFLIDREGKVAKAWRKVSVPGHAAAVLAAARALAEQAPS